MQHLVRGQPGQRQTGRLLEAEAEGLAGQGAHGGGDVLGERAPGEEVLPYVADDLVAHRELVHGDARLHDDAGDVPARDHREDGVERLLQVALAGLPVDRVDGGGPHLHEDAVRADRGVGPLAVLQDVRGAVRAVADRLHPSTFRAGPGRRNSKRGEAERPPRGRRTHAGPDPLPRRTHAGPDPLPRRPRAGPDPLPRSDAGAGAGAIGSGETLDDIPTGRHHGLRPSRPRACPTDPERVLILRTRPRPTARRYAP